MRPEDATTEAEAPSKSSLRRRAQKILDLAGELIAMPNSQLSRLPLPDSITDLVRQSRNINQRVAAKRQRQFLAKHLRELDDALLEQLLSGEHASAKTLVEQHSHTEAWLQQLLRNGDAALHALLTQEPALDRQQLRTWMLAAQRSDEPLQSSAAARIRSVLDRHGLSAAPSGIK